MVVILCHSPASDMLEFDFHVLILHLMSSYSCAIYVLFYFRFLFLYWNSAMNCTCICICVLYCLCWICVLYCICWICVFYWNVNIYFVINHYHFFVILQLELHVCIMLTFMFCEINDIYIYCFLLLKPNPSICSVGWINLYEIMYSIHVHNLISFHTSPENWVETTHLCMGDCTICIMVHLKEYAHGLLFECVLFVYCAIANEATPWVTNHMTPLIRTHDINHNWANSISVCRFIGTYCLLLLVWLCVVHSCTRVGTKNMSTGSESRWRHWLVQPWPRPGRGGSDTSLL